MIHRVTAEMEASIFLDDLHPRRGIRRRRQATARSMPSVATSTMKSISSGVMQ